MKNEQIKPFSWIGGKNFLSDDILGLIYSTNHEFYIEPYAGSATIFFHKRPSRFEVLNDLNRYIVNFYRCLQEKDVFEALKHRLEYTPYAFDEFKRAIDTINSREIFDIPSIDYAWAFFVAQNMIYSGIDSTKNKSLANWSFHYNRPSRFVRTASALEFFRDRIKNTLIMNIDAIKCIKKCDSEEALFYVDPPYPQNTRAKNIYLHEADDSHLEELAHALSQINGKFILSSYASDIFDKYTISHKWNKVCISASCTVNTHITNKTPSQRVEVIYHNINQLTLF